MPNINPSSNDPSDDNAQKLGAKFVQIYRNAVEHLTPSLIESIERGVGSDPRDPKSAEGFFSYLLATRIEKTRAEEVEKHFKEGTLSIFMCESNVAETVVDMAVDAYRVALSSSSFSVDKIFGLFVVKDFISVPVDTNRKHSFNLERTVSVPDQSKAREGLESFFSGNSGELFKGFDLLFEGKLSKLREITHFGSVEEFLQFCDRNLISRDSFTKEFLNNEIQVVLAPVKYGDTMVAMVVSLADNSRLFSSDALDGGVRNSMTVVADAFARALMLARRTREDRGFK